MKGEEKEEKTARLKRGLELPGPIGECEGGVGAAGKM